MRKTMLAATVVSQFLTFGAAAIAQTASSAEHLNPTDWTSYWIGPPGTPPSGTRAYARSVEWSKPKATDLDQIRRVGYYVRVSNVDLSSIAPGAATNPDNVKRVERLMPQAAFEARFPYATLQSMKNGFVPGKTYSYANFLKAVAALPGYCGDFSEMNAAQRTPEMADPDLICKKMLTTTLAHAVQETSDVTRDPSNLSAVIAGTFASVAEANWNDPTNTSTRLRYFDATGPFSPSGANGQLVVNNYYYGRGAKQLSYPSNYANISFLAYGTTLLVSQPDLVVEQNFLPFFTALAYALTPKDGRISIAEAMDGTLSADIRALEAESNRQYFFRGNWVDQTTFARLLKFYDRGFSLTVALVNGGPECVNDPATTTNTKIRILSYARLAKSQAEGGLFTSGFTPDEKDLMGCDDGSMPQAQPPALLYQMPYCLYGGPSSDCAYAGSYSLENRKVGQGLDTVSPNSPIFYKTRLLFVEPRADCQLVSYAGGVPIFGGAPVDQTYCPALTPIDTSSQGAN